jgi:hypothetical protein
MAAQGALDLSTPFSRLNALPTAVNWRGEWSPFIVYYKNDIVLSPVSKGTYINITPTTTITGGPDPSLNPVAWFAFGLGGGGVQEITGSEYITVGPTTTPTITNKGVITAPLDPNGNLNNLGTNQFVTLEDTGVTTALANPGIQLTFSALGPTVDNIGVTAVSADPATGLSASGSNVISLSYTGVTSIITQPTSGITVGAGTAPLISNSGILSVTTAGPGLTNSSTPQTPNLFNTGVTSIGSPNDSVVVAQFPNIKLSTVHPAVSLVGTMVNSFMSPASISQKEIGAGPPVYGLIPITQTPGTFWATSIATQTPYSVGTFILKFNLSTLISAKSSFGIGASIFTIFDSVNNVAFTPLEQLDNFIQYNRSYLPSGEKYLQTHILSIVVDLQTLWASGFRTMTHIRLNQISAQGNFASSLAQLGEGTNIFGFYTSKIISRGT